MCLALLWACFHRSSPAKQTLVIALLTWVVVMHASAASSSWLPWVENWTTIFAGWEPAKRHHVWLWYIMALFSCSVCYDWLHECAEPKTSVTPSGQSRTTLWQNTSAMTLAWLGFLGTLVSGTETRGQCSASFPGWNHPCWFHEFTQWTLKYLLCFRIWLSLMQIIYMELNMPIQALVSQVDLWEKG